MIILDETKLRNGTLRMIGEDYGIIVSSSAVEHPEWYEQEIDTIVNKLRFDIDSFKERLINSIKVELRSK
jgi:hypothetical protein